MNSNQFQYLLHAFDVQASQMKLLNNRISCVDFNVNDCVQLEQQRFNTFGRPVTPTKTAKEFPPTQAAYFIETGPLSQSFPNLSNDQAMALQRELEILHLDPDTSHNVLEALKRHIALGLQNYIDSSESNADKLVTVVRGTGSVNSLPYFPGPNYKTRLEIEQKQPAKINYESSPTNCRRRCTSLYNERPEMIGMENDGRMCVSFDAQERAQKSGNYWSSDFNNLPELPLQPPNWAWFDNPNQRAPIERKFLGHDRQCNLEQLPCTKPNLSDARLQARRRLELARANRRFMTCSGADQFRQVFSPSSSFIANSLPTSISTKLSQPCGVEVVHKCSPNSPLADNHEDGVLICCPCINPNCPLSSTKQRILACNTMVRKGFQRLAAVFRGNLTRDLFFTEKVSQIVRTVKDTAKLALSLYLEHSFVEIEDQDESKNQRIIPAEVKLERQLNVQLLTALRQLHNIFIEWPVGRQLELLHNSPTWCSRYGYCVEDPQRMTDSPPVPANLYSISPRPRPYKTPQTPRSSRHRTSTDSWLTQCACRSAGEPVPWSTTSTRRSFPQLYRNCRCHGRIRVGNGGEEKAICCCGQCRGRSSLTAPSSNGAAPRSISTPASRGLFQTNQATFSDILASATDACVVANCVKEVPTVSSRARKVFLFKNTNSFGLLASTEKQHQIKALSSQPVKNGPTLQNIDGSRHPSQRYEFSSTSPRIRKVKRNYGEPITSRQIYQPIEKCSTMSTIRNCVRTRVIRGVRGCSAGVHPHATFISSPSSTDKHPDVTINEPRMRKVVRLENRHCICPTTTTSIIQGGQTVSTEIREVAAVPVGEESARTSVVSVHGEPSAKCRLCEDNNQEAMCKKVEGQCFLQHVEADSRREHDGERGGAERGGRKGNDRLEFKTVIQVNQPIRLIPSDELGHGVSLLGRGGIEQCGGFGNLLCNLQSEKQGQYDEHRSIGQQSIDRRDESRETQSQHESSSLLHDVQSPTVGGDEQETIDICCLRNLADENDAAITIIKNKSLRTTWSMESCSLAVLDSCPNEHYADAQAKVIQLS